MTDWRDTVKTQQELYDEVAALKSKLSSLETQLEHAVEGAKREFALANDYKTRLEKALNQLRRVASAERRDAFNGVRVWLHQEWMREIDELVWPKEGVVERQSPIVLPHPEHDTHCRCNQCVAARASVERQLPCSGGCGRMYTVGPDDVSILCSRCSTDQIEHRQSGRM